MTPTLPLAWGAKVSPEFRARIYTLVAHLGWREERASDLMACMAFETGRRFSPNVRNPGSSGTGLIQFMSATAKGLGTTTAALSRMTAVDQLWYVERYFRPNADKIRTLEDMYCAILWPKAIGAPLEYVLWRTGTRAYFLNKGLDRNKDRKVTKAEAVSTVRLLYDEGMLPRNVFLPY